MLVEKCKKIYESRRIWQATMSLQPQKLQGGCLHPITTFIFTFRHNEHLQFALGGAAGNHAVKAIYIPKKKCFPSYQVYPDIDPGILLPGLDTYHFHHGPLDAIRRGPINPPSLRTWLNLYTGWISSSGRHGTDWLRCRYPTIHFSGIQRTAVRWTGASGLRIWQNDKEWVPVACYSFAMLKQDQYLALVQTTLLMSFRKALFKEKQPPKP